MQPTEQQISELRNNFLKKLNDAGGDSLMHPQDLNRIKKNDEWVRRFLLHHDLDPTESLKMMWETCEWRKKFGTNDLSESNVRMEYLLDGSVFSHGKDVDGCTLLVFKCKKHVKGQRDFEELKKCVVYWFERLEREHNGSPITVFFDMEGCGLSNMDMEYTKYLIGLFKYYYPFFLNYIIIYEMAWILNAAFKIIKSLLPEKAVAKMKFVNKTTLKEFIAPEQALVCWGGENDYVFNYIPESINETNNASFASTSSNKKVHFADGSPMSDLQGGFGDRDDSDSIILSVNPPVCLTFVQDGHELSSVVTLTNNDEKMYISYKMKTTSPEKFRVRPSTGILSPGASHSITLTLLPGFQLGGLSRDKFLVMGMPIESQDLSAHELSDLWKQSSGKNIIQHKLKCSQVGAEIIKNGNNVGSLMSDNDHNHISQLSSNISKIIECQNRVHSEVKFIYTLQWITMFFILTFFSVFIYLMYNGKMKDNPEECFRNSL